MFKERVTMEKELILEALGLRVWTLNLLVADRDPLWGPQLLDIPDRQSFYRSYSTDQMTADEPADPKEWSYWRGIQNFPVKMTVGELVALIAKREVEALATAQAQITQLRQELAAEQEKWRG